MLTLAAASSAWAASNSLIATIAVVAGIAAWRSKRGDFYKEVAAEKTAEINKVRSENDNLRAANDHLRRATDITPITEKLGEITQALERSTTTMDQVVSKVADMNGSLRAHSVAMEALVNRLLVEEATQGLLKAVVEKPPPRARRRTNFGGPL